MPPVALSWDLFIVIFFAVVMSYSFIVGKHQSIRAIIASYVAIIATEGVSSVLARLFGDSGQVLVSVGIPMDTTMVSVGKIFLFALCIIVFITRSGVDISYKREPGTVLNLVFTGLFGFAAAGLIVSTILLYGAGSAPLLAHATILPLPQSSTLIQLMILNQKIWYTLPAFLIIAIGLLRKD